MSAKWIILTTIIIAWALVILIACIHENKLASEAETPKGWVFTLPAGDAAAGKAAFMKMQCYSCHKAEMLPEIPAADMGDIGPDLTVGYHKLSDEYLAESITKAHTMVADPDYEMKEEQAGMGKYNDYLTVKELVDLVALLKQQQQLAQR